MTCDKRNIFEYQHISLTNIIKLLRLHNIFIYITSVFLKFSVVFKFICVMNALWLTVDDNSLGKVTFRDTCILLVSLCLYGK